MTTLSRHVLFALLFLGVALLGAGPARADPPQTAGQAWRALGAGHLDEALRWAKSATVEAPGDAYSWTLYGYLLSHNGQRKEAADAYEHAVTLAPSDALAQNNLGAVLLQQDRYDEAERALRAALRLRPDYADALNNLGALEERRGNLAQAMASYRAATEKDADHALALTNLGALALRQGHEEEAKRALEHARRVDAALPAPALNLLLLGGSAFATDDLVEELEAAAKDPKQPVTVRTRAFAALAGREATRRHFAEARALYLQALALSPEDPLLLNNTAVAEDQLGLDRDAMLHLENALSHQPDLLVAQNNVGIVHVHRGELELARDVFQDIVERDPRFHRAHYNLGVVLAAMGHLSEGLQSLERAAALAPRDADVRYNLGLLRRRLGGSAEDEVRAYEAALALDPDHAEAHLALGCLLADPQTSPDLRDEKKAKEHLERFLELALPSDEEGRAQANAWLQWLARSGSKK